MTRRSHAGTDVWQGVADPRERKRIQDRLAQRARRQRLGCRKTNGSGSHSATSIDRSPLAPTAHVAIPLGRKDEGRVDGELPLTVFAALFRNGEVMGLICNAPYPAKSKPPDPKWPVSLQPSALQLTTIHPQWLDRFPFPKMRDNFITLIGIIDEEEFLRDFFCMKSFEIETGGQSWDPKAWKIGRDFGRKWGYLFY